MCFSCCNEPPKPKGISAHELAKVWKIDFKTAEKSLKATSQKRRFDGDSSLSRNVSTNDRMLRYKRIKSTFFTDTMFVTKKAKSTRGNACLQLFVSDRGYISVMPMKSKSEYIDSLKLFSKEVGAPDVLVADPSGEQTSNNAKAVLPTDWNNFETPGRRDTMGEQS